MNEVSSKYPKSTHQADLSVSVINVLIGIWLIISPFVVTAFHPLMNMKANNVIVGILVAIFALIRASGTARAEWSWVNVVLGVWLIISPFILGASSSAIVVWHNVIAGLVVGLLALSRTFVHRPAAAPHVT